MELVCLAFTAEVGTHLIVSAFRVSLATEARISSTTAILAVILSLLRLIAVVLSTFAVVLASTLPTEVTTEKTAIASIQIRIAAVVASIFSTFARVIGISRLSGFVAAWSLTASKATPTWSKTTLSRLEINRKNVN